MITLRNGFHGLSMEWHISDFTLRFTTIETSALCIHYTFYIDGRSIHLRVISTHSS